MADTITPLKTVFSVCATTGGRVKDLPIKDGQLVFVQDKHRVAFDFKGKRVFYNQIEEIATEVERKSTIPKNGGYYFVIDTAILWTYQDKWIQLTTRPEDIVFIGTEIPELGKANTLYVNKKSKEISVFDEQTGRYIIVADCTNEVTNEDIEMLFSIK